MFGAVFLRHLAGTEARKWTGTPGWVFEGHPALANFIHLPHAPEAVVVVPVGRRIPITVGSTGPLCFIVPGTAPPRFGFVPLVPLCWIKILAAYAALLHPFRSPNFLVKDRGKRKKNKGKAIPPRTGSRSSCSGCLEDSSYGWKHGSTEQH